MHSCSSNDALSFRRGKGSHEEYHIHTIIYKHYHLIVKFGRGVFLLDKTLALGSLILKKITEIPQ